MPFKSKEQERYLQINEPEIYQDWVEKYGRFKEAESFEALIMPFDPKGRNCPSCNLWRQSFIGGVCSRCANREKGGESFGAEAIPIRHSRRLNGYYGIKGYEDASEDGFIYRIYRAPGTNDWFKATVYDDNAMKDNFRKPTSRRLNPSGEMVISNNPSSLLIGAFPKLEDAKRALVFRMIQDGNYHQMITDGNLKWLLKDYYAESFGAEGYDSALVHLKSLMPINRDSYLRHFRPSELTHSSTNQINFNQASVNYSAEEEWWEEYRDELEVVDKSSLDDFELIIWNDEIVKKHGKAKMMQLIINTVEYSTKLSPQLAKIARKQEEDRGEWGEGVRYDPESFGAEECSHIFGESAYQDATCSRCGKENEVYVADDSDTTICSCGNRMNGYTGIGIDSNRPMRGKSVCERCGVYDAESFNSYKVAPDLSSYTKAELVSSIAGPQGTAAYDEVVYDPLAQSRLSAESIDSFSPARLIVLGASIGVALGLYNTRRD